MDEEAHTTGDVVISLRLLPACMDCGMPYRMFPCDTTLPDDQWLMIHDSTGGLLCAGCMVTRIAKLPGVIAVRMRIDFGEAGPPQTPPHDVPRGT